MVTADGGERPEVCGLGAGHLGGVDGGDGQVVGADYPEAPLVGDVADDALQAVGVDVAVISGQAKLGFFVLFKIMNMPHFLSQSF